MTDDLGIALFECAKNGAILRPADTAAGHALVIKAGGLVREIDSPSRLAVCISAGSSRSVEALAERVGNAIWQSVS